MARRIGRQGSSPLPDLGQELLHGPWGEHACVRDPAPSCVEHRGTELDGFDRDGLACLSRYDTPERRESSWWEHRDELLAVFEVHPGERPWGWWLFEAAGICRHKRPCGLPEGAPWPPPDVSAAWLAEHGLLSARERVTAA